MKSLIQEIYDNLFENAEEMEDKNDYVLSLKQASETYIKFRSNLSEKQKAEFDEIRKLFMESDGKFTYNAFKGGFKMGFGLAFEILK